MRTNVAYQGGTPGADTNSYALFDSSVSFPQGGLWLTGIKRVQVDIAHSGNGQLEEYKSNDGGATWVQITPDEAITAVADQSTFREYQVGPYKDWKLIWTNGGSAQDPWEVNVMVGDQSF